MKLGFTFYPQDWWSSDTFFDFDPLERYVYLECLFLMYRNDGYMKTEKSHFENRIRIKVSDKVWEKVTQKFILHNEEYTSLAVNKRLNKSDVARKNGLMGGRPAKITHKSHSVISSVNQDEKAKYKEKEKENIEIESEGFKFMGATDELYITVQPNQLGSTKYRINGEPGLDEYFDMHGSIISRPEFKRKFLLERKGKAYQDFRHLWNDFNQFVNKQFK